MNGHTTKLDEEITNLFLKYFFYIMHTWSDIHNTNVLVWLEHCFLFIRCPPGTYASGVNCRPINYCERDKPCFVGSECRNERFPQNFTCVCPAGWTGRLCNILSASVPAQAGLTTGFIVIIIICIFVVLSKSRFVLQSSNHMSGKIGCWRQVVV